MRSQRCGPGGLRARRLLRRGRHRAPRHRHPSVWSAWLAGQDGRWGADRADKPPETTPRVDLVVSHPPNRPAGPLFCPQRRWRSPPGRWQASRGEKPTLEVADRRRICLERPARSVGAVWRQNFDPGGRWQAVGGAKSTRRVPGGWMRGALSALGAAGGWVGGRMPDAARPQAGSLSTSSGCWGSARGSGALRRRRSARASRSLTRSSRAARRSAGAAGSWAK